MVEKNLGKIDKGIPVPLYYQIGDVILRKIEAREFLPNQQIPAEGELASIFEVNRMTVRQAIIKLVNEGKLYRKRGLGTFVAEPKIERKVAKLVSFDADMKEAGFRPHSIILEKKVVKATDEIKDILKLKEGEMVVNIIRLRLANDQPIAIAKSLIPVKLCPSLVEENLDSVVSITQFITQKTSCKLAYAEQKIQAVAADSYQAKLLQIRKGSPLLHLYRVFNSTDHSPVGIFETSYRGDRYVFTSTLYC
jgi:GntR family transcriptional regulator